MIDTIYSDPNYLEHYGVKGMKWGVRKVDYDSEGLRSSNIYSKIHELQRQEASAYSDNRKQFRSKKREIKSDLKTQKTKGKIDAKTYRVKKRTGYLAARSVLNDNKIVIRKDFNKAYYDKISSGEIATAKMRNSIGGLLGADTSYNDSDLAKVEARRAEFQKDYMMRNYKR